MKLKYLLVLALFIHLSKPLVAIEVNNAISFYSGTFDLIDKEDDDHTSLFEFEHKNQN